MDQNTFSDFLKQLTNISPRRGLNENKAAEVIKSYLTKEDIKFGIQEFKTIIPVTNKAELYVDNESIPCLGASFIGGKISKDSKILNAFGAESNESMVIFNPISEGICLQSYKNTPTVAINRNGVIKLLMGNNISGEIEVSKLEFTSQNILVGNTNNPKRIIFAHYDCLVGSGAIDNAVAVDVIFQTMIKNIDLLNGNLFVFIGCEEESISSRDGLFGFEMFDKKYSNLIDSTEEILVLDGLGVSSPRFINEHIDWVFGISRIEKVKRKVFWMQNDQSIVMKYYHSSLDTLDNLDLKYINEAILLLKSKIF